MHAWAESSSLLTREILNAGSIHSGWCVSALKKMAHNQASILHFGPNPLDAVFLGLRIYDSSHCCRSSAVVLMQFLSLASGSLTLKGAESGGRNVMVQYVLGQGDKSFQAEQCREL